MRSGMPLSNTAAAASTSQAMLNSAAGDQFPVVVEPPMTVISRIQRRSRGSRLIAIAMLVSGPMVARISSSLCRSAIAMMKSTACVCDRLAHRLGHLGAVEAGLAVSRRDADGRLHQRLRASRRERDVEAAQLERDQAVARRVLERVVAVHRGDADEVEMTRREQDRHEVVVAGIAIDQDFLLRQACLSFAVVRHVATIGPDRNQQFRHGRYDLSRRSD